MRPHNDMVNGTIQYKIKASSQLKYLKTPPLMVAAMPKAIYIKMIYLGLRDS